MEIPSSMMALQPVCGSERASDHCSTHVVLPIISWIVVHGSTQAPLFIPPTMSGGVALFFLHLSSRDSLHSRRFSSSIFLVFSAWYCVLHVVDFDATGKSLSRWRMGFAKEAVRRASSSSRLCGIIASRFYVLVADMPKLGHGKRDRKRILHQFGSEAEVLERHSGRHIVCAMNYQCRTDRQCLFCPDGVVCRTNGFRDLFNLQFACADV